MAWIKRNLYFLIGSLIALALMVVAGFYLFTQISDEGQAAADIAAQYAELTRLTGLSPHPGAGTVDNVKAAKDQEAALRTYIKKARAFFQRITPIPDATSNKVSNAEFAAQLRNTVSQLRHSADQQSVLLPPDYYFTFEAQRKIMIFAPGSLDNLAVHLGEIKTLCDLLFAAKVNSLDNIRREAVSDNDSNPTDYLTEKTVSTPLADLTPYEVSFRCFSTELALVLGNLGSSPNAFVVKSINVEPATPGGEETGGSPNPPNTPLPPGIVPPRPRFGDPSFGGPPYRGPGGPPGYIPPPVAPTPVATPPANKPQVFLKEKLFRVTLLVEVVKLKPAK